MRGRTLALVALLVTVAPACGEAEAESGREEAQRFTVDLRPLNGSEASGRATLSMAGEHLTVDIAATDLERNRIHEQHIHGLVVADEDASCATSAEDDDGDRFVGLREGMSAWGRSLRALEPFPTVGGSGRLDYELTLTVDPQELQPLENRVLLLRGRSADVNEEGGGAEYLPDLPVACGEIRPVEIDAE